MKQSLCDNEWKIKGFWPNVPLFRNSIETGVEFKGITDWIPAKVPGSVYKDLLDAGIIEDPYYDMNSLKCEWVSNRWWLYKTVFDLNKEMLNKKLELVFEGIDYKAHVLVNNKKIGEHEGMFLKAIFDISDTLKEYGNELLVILENAPDEMSQIGYTNKTKTQKSRFNYKWDFCTRLVDIGLYADVYIKERGSFSVSDTHIVSSVGDRDGTIDLSFMLDCVDDCDLIIDIKLLYEDKEEVIKSHSVSINKDKRRKVKSSIVIKSPLLWYPNGYGDQPLYQFIINISDKNGYKYEKTYNVGFRNLEYAKCDNAPDNSLPYIPVFNGKRIYIKGVNMVPLDQMIGTVKNSDYDKMIKLVKDAGINLIRIWGGGVIESEYFYELCDKTGIMIWQEFIQSSSGVNNVPSKIPSFLKLLKKVSTQAVKEKRNHISLTFWSGGNELADEHGVPVTFDDTNIKMLKSIVKRLDPLRLFLPTSASGPNEYLDINDKGNNHDVHGPWKYEGPIRHYMTFNASDSLLHSEFGVDGMSDIKSNGKFLSSENIVLTNMKDNLVWRHHGEWWDTFDRDTSIFGDIKDLETFIKCSQYIQAEGIRYAVEANRRRMFENCGSIIWQLNEPWPNVSCTCLVDYYMIPKTAYYFLKDAYRPRCLTLKYDKLIYDPGEEFRAGIFIHNDLSEDEYIIGYDIKNDKGDIMLKGGMNINSDAGSVKQAGSIKWKVQNSTGAFYVSLYMDQKNTASSLVISRYMLFIDDKGEGHMLNELKKFYDLL